MSDYHRTPTHPLVRLAPRAETPIPIRGDVQDWLIRLEISEPLDAERRRDLDRWRERSAQEHGQALVSLLSVADALPRQRVAKPVLRRCFPWPYNPTGARS